MLKYILIVTVMMNGFVIFFQVPTYAMEICERLRGDMNE